MPLYFYTQYLFTSAQVNLLRAAPDARVKDRKYNARVLPLIILGFYVPYGVVYVSTSATLSYSGSEFVRWLHLEHTPQSNIATSALLWTLHSLADLWRVGFTTVSYTGFSLYGSNYGG